MFNKLPCSTLYLANKNLNFISAYKKNDEIGYCCVLGNAGECFGLAVYLGSEGLEGYLKMQSGEINTYSTDMLHLQKCLMVSFDDSEFLQKEDLDLIKALGLKFKGRNSWPMFRNYQPGYYPWVLTLERHSRNKQSLDIEGVKYS